MDRRTDTDPTDQRDLTGATPSWAVTNPVMAAAEAAEAVRALNHATIGGQGYRWPCDVDDVVGELHLTAARMVQALDQANRWLRHADTLGEVGHDRGDDVEAAVADVTHHLQQAACTAGELAAQLDLTRAVTAHLTGTAPGR